MRFIKADFYVYCLVMILSSCGHQLYYQKVTKNIGDFMKVVERLRQSKDFGKMDSIVIELDKRVIKLDNRCIYYPEKNDTLTNQFMRKYNLSRICISNRTDKFFNSYVSFHRDFTPFFEKADIVYYDFGKSGLRNMAIEKIDLKDEKVKIINDSFIYSVRLRPAFGE